MEIYGVVEMFNTPLYRNPMGVQLLIFTIFTSLLIGCAKISHFKNLNSKVALSISVVTTFIILGFGMRDNEEEKYYEQVFALNKALQNNDYNSILTIANNSTALLPYAIYAHSMQENLPDYILTYPITSTIQIFPEALSITKAANTALLGVYFNNAIGLTNEAIHQASLLGENQMNGECTISLLLLAQLNLEKGNLPLANKYNEDLSHTIVHKSETNLIENKIKSGDIKIKCNNIQSDSVIIIFTDQHENAYSAFLADTSKVIARDYLYCSLLQRREYNTFCSLYSQYPIKGDIPILYEEALIMAAAMSMPSLTNKDIEISKEVSDKWNDFLLIFNNNSIDNKTKKSNLHLINIRGGTIRAY